MRPRTLVFALLALTVLTAACVGTAAAQTEDDSRTEDFDGAVSDAEDRNNVTLTDSNVTLNATHTRYDIASMAQTDSRNLSAELTGITHGLDWRDDGQLLTVAETNGNVTTFDASDPWNLSTLSENKTQNLTAIDANVAQPVEVLWNETGDRFIIADTDGNVNENDDEFIRSYNVSTNWDPTTASVDGTLVVNEANFTTGVDLNPAGDNVIVTHQTTANVTSYTKTGSWRYWGDMDNISALPNSEIDLSGEDTGPQDVEWVKDGDGLTMAGADNEEIFLYDNSGSYSLSGLTLNSSLDVDTGPGDPTEDITTLAWDDIGLRLFTGSDRTYVYKWEEASTASQHTTDADFNAADTLDNVTVSDGSVKMDTGQTIDDYEDGDITEYGGETGQYEVQSTTVKEGSNALKGTSINNNDFFISSTSGLSRYPQQGDTFELWMQTNDTTAHSGFLWATQAETNSPSGYRVFIDGSTLYLQYVDGEAGTTLSSTAFSPSVDTWYRFEVGWQADGSMSATVYNEAGTQQASVSATNNSYTSGGIAAYVNQGNPSETYIDGWKTVADQEMGTYVSQNHTGLSDVASGQTNMTLTNATATVKWQYFHSSSGQWRTDRERTFNTTGNRSIELTKPTESKWRVNWTVENQTGNGEPTAELHDERIIQSDVGELFKTKGYWTQKYDTGSTNVLQVKLNWSEVEQGGTTSYFVKTGSASDPWTEVSSSEDVWQDFGSNPSSDVWVRVNHSHDGSSEFVPTTDQYIVAWDEEGAASHTVNLSIDDRFDRNESKSYSVFVTFDNGTTLERTGSANEQSNDTSVLVIHTNNGTAAAQDKAGWVLVNASYTHNNAVASDNATVTVANDELRDYKFLDGAVIGAVIFANWGWIVLLVAAMVSGAVLFATEAQEVAIITFTALVVLAWLVGMQELETAIVSVASAGVLIGSDV